MIIIKGKISSVTSNHIKTRTIREKIIKWRQYHILLILEIRCMAMSLMIKCMREKMLGKIEIMGIISLKILLSENIKEMIMIN